MFAETVDKLVLSLSGGKITSVMGLESPVTCERDDTEPLTVCRLQQGVTSSSPLPCAHAWVRRRSHDQVGDEAAMMLLMYSPCVPAGVEKNRNLPLTAERGHYLKRCLNSPLKRSSRHLQDQVTELCLHKLGEDKEPL